MTTSSLTIADTPRPLTLAAWLWLAGMPGVVAVMLQLLPRVLAGHVSGREMQTVQMAATAQSASGLSPAQLALIDPLDRDAELPVSRLAAGAAISVPTATRMLQQMEAKGLVSRRRSPADERQVLVSLTDEGLGELRLLRARLRERQAKALLQFAPEERRQLARQLRKLAEVITAADR